MILDYSIWPQQQNEKVVIEFYRKIHACYGKLPLLLLWLNDFLMEECYYDDGGYDEKCKIITRSISWTWMYATKWLGVTSGDSFLKIISRVKEKQKQFKTLIHKTTSISTL